MDIFATSADTEVQVEKDSVGFEAKESDIYKAVVKTAFVGTYDSGSHFISLVSTLTDPVTNKTFERTTREVIWSSKTKGDFYIDSRTKAKRQLIGKAKMDSFVKLLTGKSLQELAPGMEKKFHVVKQGESPIELPTITALTGIEYHVGLLKLLKNREVKSGTKYAKTNDVQQENEDNKYFNDAMKTLTEVQSDSDAKFHLKWLNKNKGVVIDKFEEVTAVPGVPSPNAATSGDLDLGL